MEYEEQQQLQILTMLEQNNLYQRISNRNLFRTLSRTYSRQTPQKPHHKQNTPAMRNIPTSIPNIHSHNTQYHNYTRFSTLQHSAKRLQLTTQTAAIFKRSESFHHIINPHSSTTNIINQQPDGQSNESSSSNSYLSSLIQRRKMSGCTAPNGTHQFRRQNFKLRSSNQVKEVTYEEEEDQTDYSILEYNKQSQLKKQQEQRQQRELRNLERMGLMRGRFKQPSNADIIKTQIDKRLAAHLFNKYTKTIEGSSFISKRQIANKSTNV